MIHTVVFKNLCHFPTLRKKEMAMAIDFDFDAALKALQSYQDLNGENDILTPKLRSRPSLSSSI